MSTPPPKAGAEVREGFTVDDLVIDDGRVTGIRGHGKGGPTVTEHARVVIGADGLHSVVARAVRPEQYHEKPRLLCGYYTYWSGLPMNGRFEVYIRPDRAFAAWPTNDDLTLVIGGWPFAEFEANKRDIEGNYLGDVRAGAAISPTAPRATPRRALRRHGGAELLSASPTAPAGRWSATPATTRTSSPPRASTTPSGTPSCAPPRYDEVFSGARPFEDAMGDYQATRDAHVLPMYEFTTQLATLEPPPPDLQQLLGAVHGNQDAMDGFARVNAGVTSPAEYFSDENVERILATVGTRQAT